MQYEYKSSHAEDERLASMCLLEQRDKVFVDLQKDTVAYDWPCPFCTLGVLFSINHAIHFQQQLLINACMK